MAQSIVLAIETSQRKGGVALRDAAGVAHVEWVAANLRHDDALLPAIDRLYRRVGLEPEATDAVGVSIGPGGFTGLRIAVSTAKMLGEALGCALVAVPSALVAAGSYQGAGPIIVALASKADTCWVTRIERVGDRWVPADDGRLADVRSLELRDIKALIGDDFLPSGFRDACSAAKVAIIDPKFDPSACLAATEQRLKQGDTTDPLGLGPRYPRRPEAVVKWRGGGGRLSPIGRKGPRDRGL